MVINLIVEPGKVYSWEEFCQSKPPYSIALDGLVDSPTTRDLQGPYGNFDHHSRCDRTSTRSTSDQVHLEINLGLFDTFRVNGQPHANVYVNDPDEDTCLAWWLLSHSEMVERHALPAINRLVYCEDRLDCTAGAYPFGDTSMRRKMAWIFEPYNDARFQGRLAKMGASEMRTVMEAVSSRISEHVFGNGKELALEGHYEVIGGGPGWSFVKETGPASRMAMYNNGIKAYIALVGQKTQSTFVYAMGRRSVWTPFPQEQIYAACNAKEGQIITPTNRWGGTGTTGGSPRETGSTQTPPELESLVNGLIVPDKHRTAAA